MVAVGRVGVWHRCGLPKGPKNLNSTSQHLGHDSRLLGSFLGYSAIGESHASGMAQEGGRRWRDTPPSGTWGICSGTPQYLTAIDTSAALLQVSRCLPLFLAAALALKRRHSRLNVCLFLARARTRSLLVFLLHLVEHMFFSERRTMAYAEAVINLSLQVLPQTPTPPDIPQVPVGLCA